MLLTSQSKSSSNFVDHGKATLSGWFILWNKNCNAVVKPRQKLQPNKRNPALFSVLVDDLVQKYGQGEVSIQKCETCNYEKIIHSSGVHHDEGGCVKVYSEEDEFSCPNCDEDEPRGK